MSAEPRRSPYLVSPAYDWAFFLLPPLASLLLGIAVSGTAFSDGVLRIGERDSSLAKLLIGTLIHAHLVAVLIRSHGNPEIRRRHPLRFLLVPVLLFAVIRASPWIAITATIVATWWDVWHSGAQTFGFGRIYDRNAGNPPDAGRRLDYWLNQLLYLGPVLGGVTLLDHLLQFEHFQDLGTTLFGAVPVYAARWQRTLTAILLSAGTLFLIYYVLAYVRLHQKGYRVSLPKVFLLVSTGACSIYTWGLNSWGEAFFIMNLFHAVQYLALVWAREKEQLGRRLGPIGRRPWLLCAIYLGAVLGYGVCAELLNPDLTTLWVVTLVVSLLHFWYDGFIWSVRARQI